jgi:hypothetical protein
LVHALGDTILFWCIWHGRFMNDSLTPKFILHLLGSEFASAIRAMETSPSCTELPVCDLGAEMGFDF